MPLITISRGLGCGGMIISRLVAEGLDLELFDDERLQEEALRLGYRKEELKGLDEKTPGFFDLILNHKPQIYLDYMEALIYEVARKGDGVIIGHGSQVLLRDFDCALHVHIYASEASRIKNLMEHRGLSEATALKVIRKSDHEQRGFFRFAFHMDWTAPSLYDLIINTEQLGIDTSAHLIMEAARSEEIQSCDLAAADAMERLALKKKIDAALLEDYVHMAWIDIEVPQKGHVKLSGYTHTEGEKAQILKAVKSVKGVLEVQEDIGIYRRFR